MCSLHIDGPQVTAALEGHSVEYLSNAVEKTNSKEDNGGLKVVVNLKGAGIGGLGSIRRRIPLDSPNPDTGRPYKLVNMKRYPQYMWVGTSRTVTGTTNESDNADSDAEMEFSGDSF